MDQKQSEAEAVADIVAAGLPKPQIVTLQQGNETASVVIVPTHSDGGRAFEIEGIRKYLDEHREVPRRRKGTSILVDLESLIAHVQRFKDAGSALFAVTEPCNPRLVAVYDYHEPEGQGGARWGEHRASYSFPLSDEWQAWMAVHEKWIGQEEFATFLEDRLHDIVEPSIAGDTARDFAESFGCELVGSARVLELSRGLSLRVDSRVAQKRDLSTGEGQLLYQEQHTDEKGEPLSVPRAFLLGLPVFRNGERFQVPVRLRYRVQNGSVLWSFALYRTDRIFDTAIREACDRAAEATELPLFYGKPE